MGVLLVVIEDGCHFSPMCRLATPNMKEEQKVGIQILCLLHPMTNFSFVPLNLTIWRYIDYPLPPIHSHKAPEAIFLELYIMLIQERVVGGMMVEVINNCGIRE